MLPVENIKTRRFLNKEMHMEFEGIDISINRFTRIEEDSEWAIQPHAHMNYELHYIYDGLGEVGLGSNTFTVSQGDYYVCPPFIDHSQKADEMHPMKEYCIECSLDLKGFEDGENNRFSLMQTINRILYSKHKDTSGTIKKNCVLLHELFDKNGSLEEGDELLAKALFLNVILSMLIWAKKEPDTSELIANRNDITYQRASSIRNYLEANYKLDITVKDCARVFYLSERQIDRILMKVFHETFHGMLTKTRVNIAINLMKTTIYPTDMVASEAGFSGYRQMLRSFKRFGIEQPTRLRKE